MFDCSVGLIVPATRQNGGRSAITRASNSGGTATSIEPVVSSCASVIVVWGNVIAARLAHAVDCASARSGNAAAMHAATAMVEQVVQGRIFMAVSWSDYSGGDRVSILLTFPLR